MKMDRLIQIYIHTHTHTFVATQIDRYMDGWEDRSLNMDSLIHIHIHIHAHIHTLVAT